MSVDLSELLARLETASRRAEFEEFELLLRQVEAAVAALPPGAADEAARARRAIAALRAALVRNPAFLKENCVIGDALAAAETQRQTDRARRLSDALYRRGKAIMAALRVDDGEEHETQEDPAHRALFAAIAAGDVARARDSLAGLDIDARHGALDETALYHALSVEARSVEMVRMLLDAGADPNAGMAEGFRPLHAVAAYPWGWESAATRAILADMLVEAGGDIEARTTGRGWTPLHRAVLEGAADEVEALLRAGADPNAAFDGRSEPWFTAGRLPLQIAGHDTAKVRLLLEYGADPHRTDALGEDTAGYLRTLIAEHVAHRAEADSQREALERSLALVRGWAGRS